MTDRLQNKAAFNIARNDGGSAIAPFLPTASGVEAQASFLPIRSVAPDAIVDQQRAYVFFEELFIGTGHCAEANEKDRDDEGAR